MGLQEKCKTFNKSSMLTQILSIHNYPPTNSHHFYVFSVPKYIFSLYSLNIVFKQFPFVHLEKSVSKFWVGKLYWNDNGNFEKTYICNCIEKLVLPPARQAQADWCWLSLHIHHIQLKVQSSHRTRIRKTSFPPHLDPWPGAIFAGASLQLELISEFIIDI